MIRMPVAVLFALALSMAGNVLMYRQLGRVREVMAECRYLASEYRELAADAVQAKSAAQEAKGCAQQPSR